MVATSIKLSVLSLCSLAAAAPTPGLVKDVLSSLESLVGLGNPYQPVAAVCPTTPLVRPATGINSNEASYISSRKANADKALASWLAKQGNFSTSSLPAVGLASSGGGLRALLEAAGVVQAFDSRDSNSSTSGLYQALTYESALSGGGWFLSSLAGNNWPTVSYLRDNLWEAAFMNTLLLPANLLSASGLTEYAAVVSDLIAKQSAGYEVTLVDAYGRLLSYQLLQGKDGGVATHLSSVTGFSNFTGHSVPYPILTGIGVKGLEGMCIPNVTNPQYEFHPYEFGSWDNGISAFTPTKYLGSSLNNGKPTTTGVCTIQYDNLGFMLGTSSDIFYAFSDCTGNVTATNSTTQIAPVLEGIVEIVHKAQNTDTLALYPNPFYNYSRSSMVNTDKQLTLVDGGVSGQDDPIWPLIQPSRNIPVLIVNDNGADTTDNFPNGTAIYQTYLNAQLDGLTKMPFIPNTSVFVSEGLNKRATFFGCNATAATTRIIYLPNVNYTYPSNQETFRIQYDVTATDGMIANGNQIATQNGDSQWPFCLACAIKNQDASLPAGCNACFEKYCYYRSGTTA